MKQLQQFAAPLALVMASPLLAVGAFAQQPTGDMTPASHAPAKPTADRHELRNFSESGHSAMRDIQDARFAIFDGNTKTAMTLMQSAKSALAKARSEAPAYARLENPATSASGSASNAAAVQRVPIDGQLVLADNFVMTPEKQAHINKADEHLKKGEHDKALEELRLGEVDVDYTQLLIPIAQSQDHLDRAITLATEGRYYEANLALKAIEDSVVAESVDFADLPKNAANVHPHTLDGKP
jgi:hypothetical protein